MILPLAVLEKPHYFPIISTANPSHNSVSTGDRHLNPHKTRRKDSDSRGVAVVSVVGCWLVAMDEAPSFILRACKLSRELESSLADLAKDPKTLAKFCDEIIKNLQSAKERLSHLDGGVQEWLRCTSYLQAMDVIQAQIFPDSKVAGIEHLTLTHHDREGSTRSSGEFQTMDVVDSTNSIPQRSRRRKDEGKKRTTTVEAPKVGNTDIPPDDNYTWRKYGQKEILGSKFPRSYYRCTHQKLYHCPAKKQVQRLDNDPSIFEVTYLDDHTCHMSATAPSIPPPPDVSAEMIQSATPQVPMGRWLSMELKPTAEGANAFDDSQVQMHMELGLGGISSRSGAAAAGPSTVRLASSGGSGSTGSGGAAAGPSSSRFGTETEYPIVMDFAEAIFNFGSCSSNNMDLIFTDDKWEGGDKKN